MPFTDGNFTITAEREDNKRLLVLHKSGSGIKIATQAGKSEPSFGGRLAKDIGRQSRPFCNFKRAHAVFAEGVLGI